MKLFTLYADLGLNTTGFNSGIDDARGKMQGVQKQMQGMQDEATKTGGVLEGALGHALGDILSGITQAAIETAFTFAEEGVQLAFSMEEITNVVDTTFGDASASRINAWARTTKESYGISALSAKEYASTMGSTLKGLGIYDDQLYDMSTALVGLAGDMASFRNLKTEDTFRKIMSGMTGEMEPLKELGIIMSATNLASHAAVMGITDDWSKLDSATQTLVRYDYLMQQTSDMQGDFAKTSESYSNQMRLLQENIEQLKLSVGESLLPAMTTLVGWFNALFGSQETASETTEEFTDNLLKSYSDISTTTANALGLVDALEELSASTEDAASTDMWNAILSQLKQTLPGIGDLIDTETGRIEGGTKALRDYAQQWASIQREMAISAAMQDYRAEVAQRAKDIVKLENELEIARTQSRVADTEYARIVEEARQYLGLAEDAEQGMVYGEIATAAERGDLTAQFYTNQLATYADAESRVTALESQLAFAQAEMAEAQALMEAMQAQVEKALQATETPEAPAKEAETSADTAAAIAEAVSSAPAPTVNVSVNIDGQELSAIVATEVDRAMSRKIAAIAR